MTTLAESLVESGPAAAKDAQRTNIVFVPCFLFVTSLLLTFFSLHLGGALRGLSLAEKMSSKLCSADAELLGNATHLLRDWHGEVQWMPDSPLQRALATACDKHPEDCNELCVNMVRLDNHINTGKSFAVDAASDAISY